VVAVSAGWTSPPARLLGPLVVDAASFVVLRRLRLERAFAFDRHTEEQGFARPG